MNKYQKIALWLLLPSVGLTVSALLLENLLLAILGGISLITGFIFYVYGSFEEIENG